MCFTRIQKKRKVILLLTSKIEKLLFLEMSFFYENVFPYKERQNIDFNNQEKIYFDILFVILLHKILFDNDVNNDQNISTPLIM